MPGEREAIVPAIPGVIAAGAKWELIWADFETADGIVGTPDGGVLFAQEQTDCVRKLDVNGKEFIYVTDITAPAPCRSMPRAALGGPANLHGHRQAVQRELSGNDDGGDLDAGRWLQRPPEIGNDGR